MLKLRLIREIVPFLPGIVKQAAKVFSAGLGEICTWQDLHLETVAPRSYIQHVQWSGAISNELKHLSLCDPPVASFSSSLTLCKSGQRENLTVCCDDDDFITKQNLVRTIILQAVTLYHASVWPAADLC